MRTNGNLSIPGTTVRLGDWVRDTLTGFEGLAIDHAHSLTGCDRIGIQSRVKGDEQKTAYRWADVAAVETLEVGSRGGGTGWPRRHSQRPRGRLASGPRRPTRRRISRSRWQR